MIYWLKMGKLKFILIVLPKELKAKADIIANADGRSLSGWVRKLITDAVNEHTKIDTN